MWRSVSTKFFFTKKIVIPCKHKPPTRCQSTSPSGKSGKRPKIIVTWGGAFAIGVTCIIGYAQYDKDFRKWLATNLPYGETIFRENPYWPTLSSEDPEKSPRSGEPVRDRSEEVSLLRKKQERESLKKVDDTPVSTSNSTVVPLVPQPTPKPTASSAPQSNKAEDDTAAKRGLKQQDAEVTAQNLALERNLRDCQQTAEQLAKDALEAQQVAAKAIKEHSEKLLKALDAESDSETNQVDVWNDVNMAQDAKVSALINATEKVADSKAAIERLESRIKRGKESKVTGNNANLLSAEEMVTRCLHQVQMGESQLKSVQSEERIATDYKDLLGKARHQFQQELLAVMPELRLSDKDKKLTEEEINFLIVHAHRRVEQLYRQLAKQQATEQQRLMEALDKRKVDDQQDLSLTISKELARQQREIDAQHLREVGKLKEAFELEMRQQLRRQAAAHSDHLHDVLQIQERELERQHHCHLEEKLTEQRGQQQVELGSSMAKLKGIEGYLQAREELDKAAHKAQQLWLACHSLRQSLRVGRGQPKPLSDDVAAIREAADQQDPLFVAVIASIPDRALSRGVYTDETLKRRYSRVETVCRRVAMIDENGGSLYRYFLSYLQSLFVIGARTIPEAELAEDDCTVDPSEWDTFEILARVRYCLERNQLETALRYANRLRGEPRNVARDWLEEVRLLLETRQAAETLIAQASATTVQAYN